MTGEGRYRTIEWLMWQMGGTGPMLGQVHHFVKYNKGKAPYAEERYLKEAHRLYGVLDKRLDGRDFVAGDYSIADIAIWPWISRFEWQTIDLKQYPNVKRWYVDHRGAAGRAEGLQGAEGHGTGPDALTGTSSDRYQCHKRSFDRDDLGFRISSLHHLADLAAGERSRDRRDIRECAVRWIGFILANDSPGLAAAILALDGHCRAEVDRLFVGWRRNELRAGAALLPIV